MAIGHIAKGAFHRWLDKPQSSPITAADIAKGRAAGGHPAKMANFARNIGHAGQGSHEGSKNYGGKGSKRRHGLHHDAHIQHSRDGR